MNAPIDDHIVYYIPEEIIRWEPEHMPHLPESMCSQDCQYHRATWQETMCDRFNVQIGGWIQSPSTCKPCGKCNAALNEHRAYQELLK